MKRKSIEERVNEVVNYFVNKKSTVRNTADHFGISKSTVHTDISIRLKKFKPKSELNSQVKKILEKNKSERHIRGGEATKRKYSSTK